MKAPRLLLVLAMLMVAGGCDRNANESPLGVSVIGEPPRLINPNRIAAGPADLALLGAVRQGLVRYDGAGQIEPGLAIRWAISDDGLYYTFRLERSEAETVARKLRAIIARDSQNPLKPVLGAIDEIVAVTPEVVEIRLKSARPNLLDLLAQPEMGLDMGKDRGGPMLLASSPGMSPLRLVPPPPAIDEADADAAPDPETLRRHEVLLRGERAALAIARFVGGTADVVLGGRFESLPLAYAAGIRPRAIRVDPVDGLFGFAVVGHSPLLSAIENRRALAMAIDRDALVSAFGLADWKPIDRIIPNGTHELPQPTHPGWTGLAITERRQIARAAIVQWRSNNPAADAIVRVALPDGPGARRMFALLRADWASIGVTAIRVAAVDKPELLLVDAVAPGRAATWYLRQFECRRSLICSEVADRALASARDATHMIERSAQIANADLKLAEIVPFIPIARPLRWSLVSPRATGFRTNERGAHPLNHLLEPTR